MITRPSSDVFFNRRPTTSAACWPRKLPLSNPMAPNYTRRAAALTAIFFTASGCSDAPPPTPPPAETAPAPRSTGPSIEATQVELGALLADPAAMLAQAEAAGEAYDAALEFELRTLVRRWHPEYEGNEENFDRAVVLMRRLYRTSRASTHGTPHDLVDPYFMFYWLEDFFPEPRTAVVEDFPHERFNAVFKTISYRAWEQFLSYAPARAKLARWQIEVEEENGRVRQIFDVQLPPLPEGRRR